MSHLLKNELEQKKFAFGRQVNRLTEKVKLLLLKFKTNLGKVCSEFAKTYCGGNRQVAELRLLAKQHGDMVVCILASMSISGFTT